MKGAQQIVVRKAGMDQRSLGSLMGIVPVLKHVPSSSVIHRSRKKTLVLEMSSRDVCLKKNNCR